MEGADLPGLLPDTVCLCTVRQTPSYNVLTIVRTVDASIRTKE